MRLLAIENFTFFFTAADDDEFNTMLEEILLSQHECVIMGEFNLPNIYWILQRPTPADGNKLM